MVKTRTQSHESFIIVVIPKHQAYNRERKQTDIDPKTVRIP